MTLEQQNLSRAQRARIMPLQVIVSLILGALLMAPIGASAQTATPVPSAALSLSESSGQAGSNVTANGVGFRPSETVNVTFNGQDVGQPVAADNGTFNLSFTVPTLVPATYGVLAVGRASGATASAAYRIRLGPATLSYDPAQAPPGTSVTATGTGFQPGETVQLSFNGPVVGTATADTSGNVSIAFKMPDLAPGQYGSTATGQTSGVQVNVTYTVLAGPTPTATLQPTAQPTAQPSPTATPVPTAPVIPVAPPISHDDRYFSQTGYRIDSDAAWTFFQQNGALDTFGYPTSRTISFLGCPAQMFQRQIIQMCPGQDVALINILDPGIFPYTQVNGSTFPAPDPVMKADTPQVGSPNYSADIVTFINQNVPDTFDGQPVNFLQYFNTTGGLTIWGAPTSQPAADPNNAGFIYQRFQRGIPQYIAGTGTVSILLADYLKAIIINQNVPPDLKAESAESSFSNQYCPGQALWLCRPDELPGTDLTFAFVQG
jgi:hypothetical protein